MVKHVVMYKLKKANTQNAEALKNKFLSMEGKIEVLQSIEAGVDILKSDRSYDVVLICQFNTIKDMAIYRDHPIHQPVKEYVRMHVESSKSVDFVE